jgi:hypothetical protein
MRPRLTAQVYPITIAEMGSYMRDADRLFSDREHEELKQFLALNPEAGDVMTGTGGIRKFRWGLSGRGKRGGVRVIYYFRDLNMPLYMLAVYAKNERIDLDAQSKKEMRDLVEELVRSHSEHWLTILNGQSAS